MPVLSLGESARTATTAQAVQDRGLTLAQGMFFGDAHSERYAPVVVLGGLLAGNLFGEQADPVGEYILVNGAPYQVIGVLKRSEGRFAAFDPQERSAYVPLLTGARRLFSRDHLGSIQIVVMDTDRVEETQAVIESLLRQRHGNAEFRMMNQAQAREAQDIVSKILTLLFGTIGGISLVVAGIGVMNIMLASVAERTREIDLRMATGARQRDILVQFVFDFGRRRRARESAQLQVESSLASYRETVIRAFNDIEVALGNIELLESLGQVLLEDLTRAEESLRIAEVRYREGVIDYQRVLTAQDFLYGARNAVLSNKRANLNAIVSLYQTLGGGWNSEST